MLKEGDIYRHYKGKLYEIYAFDTEERLIMYREMGKDEPVLSATFDEWYEVLHKVTTIMSSGEEFKHVIKRFDRCGGVL